LWRGACRLRRRTDRLGFNQRYSPLDQINRDSVSGLKAVWRASLRGSGLDRRQSGQAQTLAYDGTLYIITGADDVFAISVASRPARRGAGT
jgi:quinohemoprotein ethanol dehydrogenase